MSPVTYLITGASRGLGLETTRQLLAQSPQNRVIAAVRNPAKAELLHKLSAENEGRIEVLQLDLADEKSVKKAGEEVKKLSFAADGIDVLHNSAGVAWNQERNADHPDLLSSLQEHLPTNVFGVVGATQAFLPLLRQGKEKKIWITSSAMGSNVHEFSQGPGSVAYSISKAAVNMYATKLANLLREEGFTVAIFHPGYVQTDMNGGEGQITPQESVQKSLKTLQGLKAGQSVAYVNYGGEPIGF